MHVMGMQAIEKLKLDGEVSGVAARPTALGMHSCVGTEYIAFKKPFPLDGKVVTLASNLSMSLSCNPSN
jgi:hypothetical protein